MFIKMDIEGAEPSALDGADRQYASGTNPRHLPLHKCEHLWTIPHSCTIPSRTARFTFGVHAEDGCEDRLQRNPQGGRAIAET
jgi:hypothetical protein